jgi:hypothetical protein
MCVSPRFSKIEKARIHEVDAVAPLRDPIEYHRIVGEIQDLVAQKSRGWRGTASDLKTAWGIGSDQPVR